ncbi:deoxynucleotidyltransferase terminal-interacting protein 2 [Cyclopterus lumpus]|uniref:Deoxynucleotidyltransferase, terminal, interacting protein 2 n=1 Tax=Cyclopterus lumpus TaxID=8103 RepID=A0A8C2ZI78_CYCLU|nr:deoxynucleotidyltransferase terminal-interacting protein 2 [Cyclopterus lumpus]
MVATRRGVRVDSPTKTNPDQSSDVPASPSAGRKTRSTAKQAESPTKHALVETSSQLEKNEGQLASTPLLKRCARASRLHSPEQSCTPVGSVHEAETSDVDSCCSAVTDTELPRMRTRLRRRQPCVVSQEDEEISEVESCSSTVSASKAVRRSTRRKAIPKSPEPAHVEVGDVKVDLVSKLQRVTRSQRKTTCSRSSAKQQTEDSELSEADSCVSSVSAAGASKSTIRRSTRSRRPTGPIPIYLDETSEGSQSPGRRARLSRAAKESAAAAGEVSESQSCDSEGFESGPTYSMTTRRRRKTQSTGPKAVDSDAEPTDAHSPMGSPRTTQSKGTPCRSHKGSESSSRLVKGCSVIIEKAEDTLINDTSLESTMILEDADCTLLVDDGNQTLEEKEKEGVNTTDLTPNTVSVEKGVIVISEDEDSPRSLKISDSPACAEEAVITPAVTDRHQQEERCAENMDRDGSEKMMMQETIQPSELLKPLQSVAVTLCESASEITGETEKKDEAVEVADVDAHAAQGDEDAAVETGPCGEEKMEVSTLNIDEQQVVDSNEVQVESIQVTSSQQQNITVHSDPEQQPKDVIVQNTKIISLLDSSEDEDADDEEEMEVSGEEVDEDLELLSEERAGPSQKCDAAATAVGGLFMIDTRPGQEADELYYKERPTEEEEKASKGETVEQEDPDEFVDEEGDGDDDAELLFYSRNPLLKDASSRIDPGISLKELGGLYINFDGSQSTPVSGSLQELKEKKIQDEVMKKSVMGADFEKKDAVPPYSESKRATKLKRKTEREKSTGDGWFNMKAPEITQELKGDLQVLKMRGSMDPKRFYKKNDRDGFPKYFQVGTVMDSPVDFYHSRIPKKARKRTMVEELLSDAEFRRNNKKKYQHIVTEKAAQGAGKRNKKTNKFQKTNSFRKK